MNDLINVIDELKKDIAPLKRIIEDIGDLKERFTQLKEKVEENSKRIDESQERLSCLANSANMNSTASIVAEVKQQMKMQKKLFITAAENEDNMKATLNDILGKEARISQIVKLPAVDEVNAKSPFLVELQDESEKAKILEKKSDYFKKKKSNIGINAAFTKLQRDQRRNDRVAPHADVNRPNDRNIKSFKGRAKMNDKKKAQGIPCKFGKKCRNANACNYYHAENDVVNGRNDKDNEEIRMIDTEINGRRNIGKLLSEASGESKV